MAAFLPSKDGFRFINRFPGLPLPMRLRPAEQSSRLFYGLCGGMCFTALDLWHAGVAIAPVTDAPQAGVRLYGTLYRRQLASFGVLGFYIPRYVAWMLLPDGTPRGTQRRTFDAFQRIRGQLDAGQPAVLGLVYLSIRDGLAVWFNHQVVATGYRSLSDSAWDVTLYDPNLPGHDSVFIHTERVDVGDGSQPPVYGLSCVEMNGVQVVKNVRGFFPVAYSPRSVPPDLFAGLGG